MKSEALLALAVSALAGAALYFIPGSSAAAEILTLKVMYLATMLAGVFATLYALKGTKFDVLEEVFDENNTSAGIVVGSVFISIALVIAG